MNASPHQPGDEDRERLRLAHGRLRRASQECEALVATERMRGRWDPAPVPAEVLSTADAELESAYREVRRLHQEVLGLGAPPTGEVAG